MVIDLTLNSSIIFICIFYRLSRWSQELAEQISPWRSQLPSWSQLRVCAYWPFLRRATAGPFTECGTSLKARGPSPLRTHAHTHTHALIHTQDEGYTLRYTKWRVSWLCSGFVYGNLWDLEGGLHSMKCCFNLLIVLFIFVFSFTSFLSAFKGFRG